MFEIVNTRDASLVKLTVVGVGGSGISAVNRMISMKMTGAKFIAVDTDKTALLNSKASVNIQITGQEPKEIQDEIVKSLEGSNMVFIVTGMGGDSGSKLASIVAAYAKGLNALTVAAVTVPSYVEESENQSLLKEKATFGLKNLRENLDTTIIIQIDKILKIVNNQISLADTFNDADEILSKTVQGIAYLLVSPGLINLEFEDIRMILGNSDVAAVGVGESSESILEAAKNALAAPTMIGIEGALSVLISFVGTEDALSLMEVNKAAEAIQEVTNSQAEIMWGLSVDPNLGDNVRVVIIANRFYS